VSAYYKAGMVRPFDQYSVHTAEALSRRYGRFDELCERRAQIDPAYARMMGFEPEPEPEPEPRAMIEEITPAEASTRRWLLAAKLGSVYAPVASLRPQGRRYRAYSL
jgi:hypothetical protein